MNRRTMAAVLTAIAILVSVGNLTVLAEENREHNIKGYIWNSMTGELQEYCDSPDEVLPPINMTEADSEPYIELLQPHGFARAFYSYSPTTYTYDYQNERFKIGSVRVDNSKNVASPAELKFVVDKSGSCSTTLTTGVSYGGETNAIFAKAQLKFNAEVASTVSWSAGMSVGTNSSVPAGQIGKVTAYVVGIYSQGTATYTVLNTTTDELRYESVGIGGLIPTTNEWNLKVEIPSK